MNELFVYIIRECYAVMFCIILVACFLIVNRKYGKKIIMLFSILVATAALESVSSAFIDFYAGKPEYISVYAGFIWLECLAAPTIILVVIEIMIREEAAVFRWLAAGPVFINISLTPLVLFTDFFFSIDINNNLHIGSLMLVPRIVTVTNIVILIVVSVHNIKRSKWECILTLICSVFIVINFINGLYDIVPVDLKGVTVSMCILAYFMYFTAIKYRNEVKYMNSTFSESEHKLTTQMIDQAIETLAYTIDAKDRYTRGHSFRVARYSRQIAKLHGMDEDKCREVYLAGLLHDIGKISISDTIINKAGELTAEEYELIKKHPVNGAKILEKMVSFPSLQDGAKYHHERYDGLGYPYGIKGEEIPEMARIIAVADAYDTMTSHRTYRESMDQAFVKQEIWKGMGTQFDPHFGKIMISLIDADVNYDMREKPGNNDEVLLYDNDDDVTWPIAAPQKSNGTLGINYKSFGDMIVKSDGWGKVLKSVHITEKEKHNIFFSKALGGETYLWYSPTVVIYSSRDGRPVGSNYEELAVFLAAGYSWQTRPALRAKADFVKSDVFESWDKWILENKKGMEYSITVRRENNMVYITIDNELIKGEGYVRLPENYNKHVYYFIAGERCELSEKK